MSNGHDVAGPRGAEEPTTASSERASDGSTEEKDSTRKYFLYAAVAVVTILLIQAVAGLIIYLVGFSLGGDSWALRGQFGDMFGAVNALFSGLAFAGVILAIILQRDELALQRRELALNREELEKNRGELSRQVEMLERSSRLSAMSTLTNSYGRELSGIAEEEIYVRDQLREASSRLKGERDQLKRLEMERARSVSKISKTAGGQNMVLNYQNQVSEQKLVVQEALADVQRLEGSLSNNDHVKTTVSKKHERIVRELEAVVEESVKEIGGVGISSEESVGVGSVTLGSPPNHDATPTQSDAADKPNAPEPPTDQPELRGE